ncbi:MAG: hypothetical protein LBQ47_02360, partial [Endomicrobium sp.]|nr:hypothetical protein [Endomicrobium sp.]
INFQGNASFLSNTVTNNHGGAIYLDKSNLAASKDIEFIGNRGQNGGAIYAISNTGITFSGDSSFTNNTALTYGGAIYATDTNINFLGNTSFASNTAANYSGGAICLTRSNLTVSKDAEFIGNKAERHGGAVTAVSNTTIILSGNSSFSNNAALAYGGAIYAYDAINMSFQGSASFTNNTSDIGGAVYAGNNTAITVLGNLSFADNAALGSGGGIYLRNSSLLVEGYDTTTIFKNNTAYSGSAIRFDGGVTALFANGNFEFQINGSSMNTSMGTIDVFNSQSDYNSPLIFKNVASLTASGNVAAYGGFIAIRHNDLKISGDNINIGNNMAFLGYGGAIHAESADIELEGTLNFENNFAHINGGAIYASVSTITIKSIGDGITFRNNSMNASAGSESNDIYINDSMLLLYGTNYIEFSGGISGNSLSEINKYDENTVYLGGKTDFEGVLNIAEGSVSITAPNVNIAEINIAQDAILTGTTVHTASAKKLNVDGQIQFGVDFTNNTADKFIVSLGTTTLSDSSKWSVLQIGRSRKDKVYTILESDFIIGEFSNEKLNIADLEYSLQYYDNRIDLVSRYIGYQALQGNTANQKAIAGLFNTIYFDEERFNAMSDDMVNLTDDIFELRQISATLFEKAAANLSGKFYADIIMSAGEMYNNSILFNRLNVDLLSYKNSKNFWTQGIMRSKTLPSDENQLGNFKNTAVGGMFGADIVYGKSMIIGLFGQYLANEYLQDDNCADGQEIGFGLYAFKALGSALNLKSSLSYNTQKIKAKRSFSVSETYKPEAEFNLSAIKIAALAEKDFKIKDKLSIMPFIGVAGAAIFNGEIKEEGANNVNLIIDGATNSRLDGTFGINANYNINKFLSLYGGFNGRAAIFGKKGTIKEVLAREREHSMEIESAEELLYLGLDLQLDYKIGENFIVYINGNYGTNSQYLVGLGLSYRVMSNKI